MQLSLVHDLAEAHVGDITPVHRLRAAGLLFTKKRRPHPSRSIGDSQAKTKEPPIQRPEADPEDIDDVIVVSDSEDDLACNKKDCRDNPFCLNHLGQDKWDDSGMLIMT